MLAVPVFSLLLLPGDAVVLSAVLALILGLMSYRSWWGLFPVTPAVPMVSGSLLGTAVGVWFLASLSVTEFQLWIGISVVAASLVLSRFTPRESAASGSVSLGTGVASGLMNGALCHPRTAGHSVCGRRHGEPRALAGVSDDVLLVLQHCVAGHVWHCGADYPKPFQLLWVALPRMWLGNQLATGPSRDSPGPPTGRLSWGCVLSSACRFLRRHSSGPDHCLTLSLTMRAF